MNGYLVFRLYGCMASWGGPAVGGSRQSACYPGRSALLGILAAALGINRQDDQGHQELGRSVRFAVKIIRSGGLVRDYHTTQVPATGKQRYKNRKSALAAAKLHTVLSERDYRTDAVWVVAVWLQAGASVTLQQLKTALDQPVYPLYLGRKSCPLGLPLSAHLVANCQLQQALDSHFPTEVVGEGVAAHFFSSQTATYIWEGARNAIAIGDYQWWYTWENPISRSRRQFLSQQVHMVLAKEAAVAK